MCIYIYIYIYIYICIVRPADHLRPQHARGDSKSNCIIVVVLCSAALNSSNVRFPSPSSPRQCNLSITSCVIRIIVFVISSTSIEVEVEVVVVVEVEVEVAVV